MATNLFHEYDILLGTERTCKIILAFKPRYSGLEILGIRKRAE